jgi:hypothetical protein
MVVCYLIIVCVVAPHQLQLPVGPSVMTPPDTPDFDHVLGSAGPPPATPLHTPLVDTALTPDTPAAGSGVPQPLPPAGSLA